MVTESAIFTGRIRRIRAIKTTLLSRPFRIVSRGKHGGGGARRATFANDINVSGDDRANRDRRNRSEITGRLRPSHGVIRLKNNKRIIRYEGRYDENGIHQTRLFTSCRIKLSRGMDRTNYTHTLISSAKSHRDYILLAESW